MADIRKGVLKSISLLKGLPYADVELDGRTERVILSKKALWALLRFNYGNQINETIKKLKMETKKFDFVSYAIKRIQGIDSHKKYQYIITDKNNESYVISIASLKHSIKTEEMVYDIINKALKKRKYELNVEKNLLGRTIHLKTVSSIIQLGVQIYAGDLLTQKAIKITPFAKIASCMNPLSWMGIKKVWFSKERITTFIIRRFEKISYLEDRIPEILGESLKMSQKIGKALERSKKINITELEAKKLLLTTCKSYGLGIKPIERIYNRWLKEEKNTVYGLAMACSYFSVHEDIFKKKSTKVFQSVSSIAGALLLIRSKKETMTVVENQFKGNDVLQKELALIEEIKTKKDRQ